MNLKEIAETLLRDIESEATTYPAFINGMKHGVQKLYERVLEAIEANHKSGGTTETGAQQDSANSEAAGTPDPGTGTGLPAAD